MRDQQKQCNTSASLMNRIGGSRLASADFHIWWKRIGWVWVKIWPQAIWCHAPTKEVTDRNNHFRRRNFHLHAIEPTPDMHLTDLRAWNAFTDSSRQMHLPAGHFDRLRKGFF